MNRQIPFLIIVVLFLLSSCGQSIQEKNLIMRDKIISVHDEVMPMMSKLKILEKKANQEIQALGLEGVPDSSRIDELNTLIIELNSAYDGMFDWMHQYEVTDGERTPEEVQVFLDEQLVKITKVNTQFKEVIAKADEILED